MLKTIRWCFMGLCLAFANAQAAPILQVDGSGKLLGADGVDVGGTLYDVRFVDDSCAALYSDCDSVADFPFATPAGADLASEALLAQVLLDGALGSFDTVQHLTNGCEPFIIQPQCRVFTPKEFIGTILIVSAAANWNIEGGDQVAGFGTGEGTSTSGSDTATYALWSLHSSAAPLPGTLSCLGLGLFALVLANRRRAQARLRTQ